MNIDILLTGTLSQYNGDVEFKEGNILNYAEVIDIVKDTTTGDNCGVTFTDKITG